MPEKSWTDDLTRPSARRRLRRAIGCVAALAVGAGARAQPSADRLDAFATSYAVQSVCLDSAGRVIAGASPLSAACARTRSLVPGEALPYHKHDWPSEAGAPADPRGVERSDSFPAELGGTDVVVQTFDLGPAAGRRFGVFDPGDGGQIVKTTDRFASIILTEARPDQIEFLFGPECARPTAISALYDGWILFDRSAMDGASGSLVARLRHMPGNDACPAALNSSLTQWRMADIRYRASLDHTLTRPLRTIVTDHFAKSDAVTSGSMERMYFTRELGWTRWEKWSQPVPGAPGADEIEARARRLAASRTCEPRYPGPARGHWTLALCREWTNIQPSDAPGGDPPDFWISRLNAASLFR